ncbi:MAG: TonB-dependent receptor domain-containing protein, partial [Sphingomonadaceae bacterium]
MYEQWSQELQLVFPGSGVVEGIVGAYYADADATLAFYQLLPLVNPQPLNDFRSTSSDPASALFGQATVHFADRWSTTAGLRLSQEEHRVTTIGTGLQDSPTLLVGTTDSDDLSWRLDLRHAISDDAMVYAGVSTGYKSGGFITTSLTDGEPDGYGPEHLT